MARKTNRDIFRTIEQRIQKSQRKYERQGFTVNLPTWFTDLQERATQKGKRITKKMLGEAEKLAKNFKRTTVPKAERDAEKERKAEEARREQRKKEIRDRWSRQGTEHLREKVRYHYEEEDDELFHPQYEDAYYEDELPDESSAILQEVITRLEDALANGVLSADELLLALQTAIDTEGERKVAKGIASVGDDLEEAIRQMKYWSEKVNPDYERQYADESLRLISKGIHGVTDLAGSGNNGYGL